MAAAVSRQAVLSGNQGKAQLGGELPGHLGQEVVVGGRPVARQPGQPLLVVVELLKEDAVALEQRPGPGPAVQQPADPDPGQQSHAQLDAAGPVDAGQEGVGRPPRPELGGDGLGVPLVAIEMVRGRQDRQVLVAGRLPHLLDVADRGRVAVVDVEAVGPVGRSPAGGRVQEPVRRRCHVVALAAEHRPASAEQPLGGLLEPDAGLLGDVVAVPGAAGRRRPDRRPACRSGRRRRQ